MSMDIAEDREEDRERRAALAEADREWEGLHGFYLGSDPAVPPLKKPKGFFLTAFRALVRWFVE